MKRLYSILLIVTCCLNIITVQNANAEGGVPEISAPSALLMDFTTGKILYEKNPDEKRPLASVTKIMTMLIAMEEIAAGNLRLDDVVTGSAHAKSYGGSTIFLDEGEQMSVNDILKGIAVASGNDASVALGEHISGSEGAFVERMNKRASELGMNNTSFVNCNGLDADGHYSSARDIALMSRELMKHTLIFNYTTIWMDSLRNGDFTLSNTNKLVKFYDGCTGLKTGSTSKAGFCISATAMRDNLHLIAVIMGAETSKIRQAEASSLLNYGFSAYSLYNAVDENQIPEYVEIQKGKSDYVRVYPEKESYYLGKKNEDVNFKTEIIVDNIINAPIKKGDVAGSVKIYCNDTEYETLSLICDEDVEKISFAFEFKKLADLWLAGIEKV